MSSTTAGVFPEKKIGGTERTVLQTTGKNIFDFLRSRFREVHIFAIPIVIQK
ncbi:hypothetical protein [Oscillatoria sp. FACHB-1406]|uniref:hypothetical protein n=1 Tax=Oscillatoria sp. FACHB-1406 TaxID=2692846 RepID=UPI0016877807|nr:hypothetical protein [Oscillatoria sp. FACHB-1406]MBD2578906.1 hypothetical protein [Oscillatoria sp. FACHB-1406]